MPSTSTTQILNEKNIKLITENINKVEVKNYQSNYHISLLAYIPFLSESANIDIVNLDNSNKFIPSNFISNNGFVESNVIQDPDDPVKNLNGEFQFQNTDTDKDLYYKSTHNTNAIDVVDNTIDNFVSVEYIEEDGQWEWNNFMFWFRTDQLTPRIIGIFNGGVVVSINNSGRLEVSINLIDIEMRESYNIILHSQGTIRVNRATHISIFRDIYRERYRYVLYINGFESDNQFTEIEYYELKMADQSKLIYPDNPCKTKFWFHEDKNIKTSIDEIFIYKALTYSSDFPVPTKYPILSYPIDVKLKNSTRYESQIKEINNDYVSRNIEFTKAFSFDLKRAFLYSVNQYVERSILQNESDKDIVIRSITNTETDNWDTNVNHKFKTKFDINIKTHIQKKDIIPRNILKNIIVNFYLRISKSYISYTHTNLQSTIFSKTHTSIVVDTKNTNYCLYILKQKKKINSDILFKNNIKIKTYYKTGRNIKPDGSIRYNTKRLITKKLSSILDKNIVDLNNLDLKPTHTCRNIVFKDDKPFKNLIYRNVVNTAKITNIIERNVKITISIYHDTRYRNSDLDIFVVPLIRQIKTNLIFTFDDILHRKIAIPFISKTKVQRIIAVNLFKLLGNNNKPLFVIRKITKNIITNTHVISRFASQKAKIVDMTRYINKTINMKSSLSRKVQFLKNVPFAFVLDTGYYT